MPCESPGAFQSRETAARKQAEEALRVSEEKYRLLTEGMKDVVWILDVESRRFLYVSPSVEKLRGYTPAEILAQPLEAAWVPEQRAELEEFTRRSVEEFLAGRMTEATYVTYEMDQPCKDGSTVPSEIVARLVRNQHTGRIEAHGVTRDISARRRAEAALRDTLALLDATQRIAKIGGWVWDVAGQKMTWAEETYRIHGFEPGEFAANSPEHIARSLACYDPVDRPLIEAAFRRCVMHGDPYTLEFPLTTAQGRRIWIQTSAQAVRDGPRIVKVVGHILDITSQKRAEEALRESETRLRALTDNLPGGLVYQIDTGADGTQRNFAFISQGVAHLHGVSVAEALQDAQAIYGQVLEEDRPALIAREVRAISTMTPFSAEVRVRLPSGEIRWRHFASAPRRLPNGHLVWDGIELDVAERKRAEDSLRETTDNLRATLNATTDGILAVGPDRKILFFSQRFAELWNIPPSMMDNRDDQILLGHVQAQLSDPAAFLKEVRRLYESDENSFDTIHFRDGRVLERNSYPLRTKPTSPPGRVWSFRDITKRHQAEAALKTSETRYRELIDFAVDGILLGSHEGIITDANACMCALTGRTRAGLIGMHVRGLFAPKTLKEAPLRFDLLQQGATVTHERKILRPDGSEVLVEMHTKMMPDGTCQSMYRDITERKRADEELRRSEAELAEAQKAAKLGSWSFDIATNQVRWSKELYRIFGTQEKTPENNYRLFLECVYPEDRARVLQANARARTSGKPFEIEYRIVTRAGGLKVIQETGYARRNAAGKVVGLFGTAQDITERKRAEEALVQSEAKYRQLFEALRDPFATTDLKGRLLEFNRPFQDLLGYSKKQLLGRSFRDITPRKWHAAERKIMAEQVRKRGFSSVYEKEYVHKDGTVVPVELRTMLVCDAAGNPTGMSAIIRDISGRKKAEEALKQSESKYRQLHETMRDAFVSVDMKGRILESNRAYQKLTGYSEKELLRLSYQDLTPKKWRAIESNIVAEQIFPRGYSEVYEKEYLRKDGTAIPIELRTILIRNAAGRPVGMSAIIRDISERKRTEHELEQARDELEQRVQNRTAELESSRQALAKSEEQFRQMAGCIQEVFWLVDAKSGRALYVSPAFDAIWGRPRRTLLPDFSAWLRTLHPDDRDDVLQDFTRGLAAGKFIPLEYRILRPDGSIRWIRDNAWAIRDAKGRIIRIAGVFRDITEQRRLEGEILRAGEMERLRIGHDLHDSLGQSLTGIGYLADAVREELARKSLPEEAEMRKLTQVIGKAADHAHEMARGLLPVDLKPHGIVAALQELAVSTQELLGVPCRYAGLAEAPPLGLDVASQLYRIAQEAATNAAKHSRAKSIKIHLIQKKTGLQLTVRDTGTGLPLNNTKGTGLGLDIMRYRAGHIGATFWIDSQHNRGTAVHCRLPLAAPKKRKR